MGDLALTVEPNTERAAPKLLDDDDDSCMAGGLTRWVAMVGVCGCEIVALVSCQILL